ncbi:hypothetical protein BDF19DRAFT_447811 [Syncephalis fuscata]|nr:hypothetical protein BDF19DRAFT_447811 [Syncephalis fuscata]
MNNSLLNLWLKASVLLGCAVAVLFAQNGRPLRCNDHLAICIPNRIEDTRSALEGLEKQLLSIINPSPNDPSLPPPYTGLNPSEAVEDILVMLRGSPSKFSGETEKNEMQGTTPYTFFHCSWRTCASIRLRKPLPDKRRTGDEHAIITAASERIRVMMVYINLYGRIASDSCDTTGGAPVNPSTHATDIASTYGLTVRYWQQVPEAGNC